MYPALPNYGLLPGGFRSAFLLKPYILKVGLSDFPSHLGTPFLEIPSQHGIDIHSGIFQVAGILLLSLRYYFYSCLLLSYLIGSSLFLAGYPEAVIRFFRVRLFRTR